jgi:Flp pilus assembly protein TadG
MRAQSRLRKRSQGGQAIVLFTLMVSTVLIPITGLAIDGGRGYLVRLKLSSAVDGGALAAARLLGTGSNATVQLANAKATATQFVAANFPSSFFGANLAGTPYVCIDPGTDNSDPCNVGNGKSVATYKMRTVLVTASAAMPTLFMRILGMPTSTVASRGLASRRDVRVILVMDRSSSMSSYYTGINQTPPSIQDTALKFVNGFSGSGDLGGRDEVGLVVFGGSGIVAYPPRDITKDYTDYTKFTPPDNNFKLSGNIPKYITDLKSGSNTGTAEALYLAYMTLRADAATNTDLSTKLNVIVLFTDGLPNGVTAFANDPSVPQYSMMKSSSNCTDLATGKGSWTTSPLVSGSNTNMIGWFAQWNGFKNQDDAAHGLFPPMMAYACNGASCGNNTGFTGKGDDIDAYMKYGGADSPSAGINQMTPASTCGSTMNGSMASFPDRDLYGNYTDLSKVPAVPTGPGGVPLYQLGDLYKNQCGSTGYSATSTKNNCQIGLASWQATAHQAWKIWNQILWDKTAQTNKADPAANLSQPVIFTIGFDHSGGTIEPPDMTLLKMIANDPSSPVSFSSRVKGQAFRATDPNAVDNAFSQIASQILRLSQ